MKAWEFQAVTFDADVYCTECLPEGVSPDSEQVHPIFASQEWDRYPTCCVCGREHDYVGLTEQAWLAQFGAEEPEDEAYEQDYPTIETLLEYEEDGGMA